MQELEYFTSLPRKLDPDWDIPDSDFWAYLEDLGSLDTDNKIMGSLTELKNAGESIVIDLMAPTTALDSLYEWGLRGKLLAVGKNDDRQLVERRAGAGMGVDYYKGNLKSTETWRYIDRYLDGADANMIMERGYGGLHYVRTDPYFYRAVLTRMWSMLSPNKGLLVLQTPNREKLAERGMDMYKWMAQLKDAGIYGKYDNMGSGRDFPVEYGILILEKSFQGSLPILQPTRR